MEQGTEMRKESALHQVHAGFRAVRADATRMATSSSGLARNRLGRGRKKPQPVHEPEPVKRFAQLLGRDRQLAYEVSSALGLTCLVVIGAGGSGRANQLQGQVPRRCSLRQSVCDPDDLDAQLQQALRNVRAALASIAPRGPSTARAR